MKRNLGELIENYPEYLSAIGAALQALRERKDSDMVWHVAAAAQAAMPPGSNVYHRAVAAGIVIGLLSKQ